MSMLEYGEHRQQHWLQTRSCCCLAFALVIIGTVFFVGLGAVYLPYLEAYDKHTDAHNKAQTYLDSVCNNPQVMGQLGTVGKEDCAAYERTMKINIEKAASREVLKMWNLCPEGECFVMSFSLVTMITTFLPLVLLALGGLVLLLVAWVAYQCFGIYRRNEELPIRMASAFVAASHLASKTAAFGKSHTE
jgi:hypothetical protein